MLLCISANVLTYESATADTKTYYNLEVSAGLHIFVKINN